MGRRVDLFSVIFFVLSGFFFTGTKQGRGEHRLIAALFKDYNELERPVRDYSDSLEVQFSLTLQQIIEVQEKYEVFVTNMWLNLMWHDYRLRWDPMKFANISVINMPMKQVWRPDILMYNSVDDKYDLTFPANVVIHYSGTVRWVPPGLFKSGCNFDIKWFPFDKQICELRFGSWTYDGSKINLTLSGETGDISTFIPNGEWDLIGMPAKRLVNYIDGVPWIKISFYVSFRRRPLHYTFNLVVPSVFLSALAVLTFALPVESGEKVSLGVTILLSLTVFLLLVADTLPPTSEAVPLLGIYFAGTLILSSLSVLFTVLVLNFFSRRPKTHKMPVWVKTGICCWLAWMLGMERTGRYLSPKAMIKNRRLHLDKHSSKSLLANVLDLDDDICSVLRIRHYYTTNPVLLDENKQYDNNDNNNNNDDEDTTTFHRQSIAVLLYEARPELVAILRELKTITNKLRENETIEEEVSDWKYAAMVIDRLCLYVFAASTFLETLVIFLSAFNLYFS